MELSLFFAGTGGAVPTPRRGLPAIVIRAGGDRILVDCGEGTQRQLIRSIGLPDLDAVFLTHYHADHWFGLPGMLKTFDLRGRDKPLTVYGPPGLRALFTALRPVVGRVGFPLDLVELDRHDDVPFDGYAIGAFPVEHRVPAYGYAVVEPDRPGRFDPEEAIRLGVTPGPDFRRLQQGETIDGVRPEQVIGEPRRGRRVVISGDTRPCQGTLAVAHRADLLIHEATFTEDDADRARLTGHSTAREAAEIARDAEVERLALVHLTQRTYYRAVRDEARATFAAADVPRDFDAIEVPFPERGGPRLVRWDEQEAQESRGDDELAAEAPEIGTGAQG